jgi:hypothetical protein
MNKFRELIVFIGVRLENLAWDYLPFLPYLVAGIITLVMVFTFWIFG